MKHPAQKLLLSFFSLALIPISYYLLSSPAIAQTSANIMTVIPPRLEISAKPGETIRKIVQFRNESDNTAYLAVSVKDFIVNNNTGQPYFVDARVSGRWAASSWIKTATYSLSVSPKTISNLGVTIDVPADALPGGHYAGILYEAKGATVAIGKGLGAGSAITQVVGTLVYINVAGPVTENAIIKKFEVPGFSEYGPIPFSTEINNLSDTHITPIGQITVRNLFGQVATQLKLDERNIFPGASLLYTNTWPEKLLIGRFRADLEVAYGSGKALTATAYFWVFPWKITLIITLTIILIGLIAYLGYKKIKSRQEELEEKLAEEEKEINKLKEEIKDQK